MPRIPFNREESEAFTILGPYGNGVWDDLRAPSAAINPPGAASDPGVDPNDGMYVFDSTGVEVLFIQQQLPHGWKQGSNVRPHIHWAKTSDAAGTVAWKLEYKLCAVGAVYPAAFTSLGIVSVPEQGLLSTQAHVVTAWGDIDLSAYANTTSLMIFYKLSRVPTDLSDTYGADAKMFEFDTHYLRDCAGTIHEYIKQARYDWQAGI